MRVVAPWRVVLPVSLGTALSLMGDSALYTVLPLNLSAAGITLASVGILLSVNRLIRLIVNTPVGLLYDRWPRRRLFLPALYLGALSTAIYAMTRGFMPLFVGRILWGLAWTGIWIGGNTIILDISHRENRGRLVGFYQAGFFLGAASGAMVGGILTDILGFHQAMYIGALLTLLGAIFTTLTLPETKPLEKRVPDKAGTIIDNGFPTHSSVRAEFIAANALYGVNRLVVAGIIPATLGLYLSQQFGESVLFVDRTIGVASVTGIGLGMTTLTSMITVSIPGRLSDRTRSRWVVVVGGLLPGLLGFSLLTIGTLPTIVFGLLFIAVMSGSNTALSTALVGDLGNNRRGRRLGVLYTVGDLGSAIGPLLAYSLFPLITLEGVYLAMVGLLTLMLGFAIQRARNSNTSAGS